MKKKMLLFVLAGCMACSMNAAAVTEENGEKVITYACWEEGATQKAYDAVIEQYNATHEGVKVVANYIPYGEYLSKMSTLIAADSMPDVFKLIEGSVYEWGSKGVIADLKPMYEEAGIDPYEGVIEESVFTDGEHIYSVSADNATFSLYYNKELFAEAGIEPPSADVENPWTWEEFVEAAKLLTKDGSGYNATQEEFDENDVVTYGTIMPVTWTRMMPLLESNDAGYASEDGMTFTLSEEAGIEVVQAVADLSLVEKCAPTIEIANGAYSDTATMLMNGQVAMYIDGSWSLPSFTNEKFDIGLAPVPAFKHAANVTWTGGVCIAADVADDPDVFEFYCYMADYKNILSALKANDLTVGATGSKWLLDTDEGMQEWLGSYNDYNATEVVNVIKGIMKSDSTVLGENVTLKNFQNIVDITLMPELDSVWQGDKTAKEVLESLNMSGKMQGSWVN